ncbi:MAG TPA: glucose 1-dehydrogenase [Roseiflexaceae bacterium]|nr:glucose 1-dehydrogenase [Roseiflexaceae bacterium]HMP41199.1 glucose 1-dehydrogenase [Roseiflexaceae bacterium]
MAPPLTFDLSGKVVVVTGAGRGIGRSIAEACAYHGADLALGSRTVAESEAVAADIRNRYGRRTAAWPLDVGKLTSINTFVDQVQAAFGRIDVLVNNAGINIQHPALDYTEAEYDQIVDVNLKGVFFLSTAAARSMIEHGSGGSIITITSQAGVVGAPLRSVYSAAKAGAAHLARTLAAEWAPHNITVNAVAPTFTRTPLLEAALGNPAFARNLERVPLGRIAEPEEIAAAVVFLASPAARMITGQELCVDGGFTAV